MSESLIFEGKKFISAKRAAEITGYATDYIGQLCRSGKIDSKLVGRNWYVLEESLKGHEEEMAKAAGARWRKVKRFAAPRTETVATTLKMAPVSKRVAVQVSALKKAVPVVVPTVTPTKKSAPLHFAYQEDNTALFPLVEKTNEVPFIDYYDFSLLELPFPEVQKKIKKIAEVPLRYTDQAIALMLSFLIVWTSVFGYTSGVGEAVVAKTIAYSVATIKNLPETVSNSFAVAGQVSVQTVAAVGDLTFQNVARAFNRKVDDVAYQVLCSISLYCEIPTSTLVLPKTNRVIVAANTTTTPTIINGTRTIVVSQPAQVIERTVERTVSGVSREEFDLTLSQLSNKLSSQINYLSSQLAGQANAPSGIYTVAAGGNRIPDSLSGTRITNPTISGGTYTNATVNGTLSGTFSGSISGDLTLGSTTIATLTLTQGTSTNFTVGSTLKLSSLLNCDTLDTDSDGNIICGVDGGGGSGAEVNWTYFNRSGVRVSTTSNQVLIGATATTTLAKLEVIGNQYVSGNLGIGTTTPFTTLSVAGSGYFDRNLTATNITATGTLTVLDTGTSTFQGGIAAATLGITGSMDLHGATMMIKIFQYIIWPLATNNLK
jgi:hypothetical protein